MSAARGHEPASDPARLRVQPEALGSAATRAHTVSQQLGALGVRIECALGAAGLALPGSALAAAMKQAGSRYRALLQAESERLDGLVRSLAGAGHAYETVDCAIARAAERR